LWEAVEIGPSQEREKNIGEGEGYTPSAGSENNYRTSKNGENTLLKLVIGMILIMMAIGFLALPGDLIHYNLFFRRAIQTVALGIIGLAVILAVYFVKWR
jgi:hypothetical protein